jgi:hypothetical protein
VGDLVVVQTDHVEERAKDPGMRRKKQQDIKQNRRRWKEKNPQ